MAHWSSIRGPVSLRPDMLAKAQSRAHRGSQSSNDRAKGPFSSRILVCTQSLFLAMSLTVYSVPVYDGTDMSKVVPNKQGFQLSSLPPYRGELHESTAMIEFSTNMYTDKNGIDRVSLSLLSIAVLLRP